jgi:RNA polymerase sigma factor (sigma-70 family)
VKQSVPFVLSELRRGKLVEQAAHTAREILVERARYRTVVNEIESGTQGFPVQLLNLDRAMNALAEIEPRKSKAIELRHFAGLSPEQVAETLEIPVATVQRDLRFAEAWLCRELSRDLNRQ